MNDDQSERQIHAIERIADAQERQADAAEALAGLFMLWFDYHDDTPEYSVEALYKEVLFFGTGGERL